MSLGKHILLLWVSIAIFTGCSVQKEGIGFSKPVLMSSNAMVVFFRKGGNSDSVASVWVDNRIVGTLLPGNYAQSFICPGKRKIRIEGHHNGNNLVNTKAFKAKKGEVLYLQVSDTSTKGHFAVRQVEPSNAEAILKSLKTKSHIINRHSGCRRNYVELDADTLFVFGKSSLSPAGKKMLGSMAKDLQENVTVKKLRVEGYTDRLGSSATNDRISLERAKAVASYLKRRGINVPIKTIGLGERDPISKGCIGNKPTPELLECLAPDRRVKIEIIGLTSQTAN